MKILITKLAGNKLKARLAAKSGYLKLKYDIDDCGCGVNGVPVLLFVNELDKDDEEIETEAGSIYIEKSQLVFFDEKMTIDFSEKANCFQLKSTNEYLNPRMSFYDRT